jgi:hypothetical protein
VPYACSRPSYPRFELSCWASNLESSLNTNTDLLTLLPDPMAVHRRLGDLVREQRLLRRLLRLTLAAQQERSRRSTARSTPEGGKDGH